MTAGIRGDWHAVQYTYDAVDRITRATDTIGRPRDLVFDHNGNLAEERLLDSNNLSVLDRTLFSYDPSDRRTSVTAFGNLTTTTQ
ncbi:MAG: hypothetical protein M3R04_10640, partial [bacterium]|nr:hypothetical protein [bacterium]